MKSPALILLTSLLMAGIAGAQYAPAKQRARDVSGRMTERQNVTADGSPASRYGLPQTAPPATPPPTAENSVSAPTIKPSTQQQAATKVKADLAEARAKGEATAELKKQFVQDLSATAQGYNRPSLAALTRFGESLLTAVATKKGTAADDARLVKNVVISLNSAGLSPARLQEISEEIHAVLTKSGISADETSLITQHLSAAVSDIQSGGVK